MSGEDLLFLWSGKRQDAHSFYFYFNFELLSLVWEMKFLYDSEIEGFYTQETVLLTIENCMKHCVHKRNKPAPWAQDWHITCTGQWNIHAHRETQIYF